MLMSVVKTAPNEGVASAVTDPRENRVFVSVNDPEMKAHSRFLN
jgi:hypothetical protein